MLLPLELGKKFPTWDDWQLTTFVQTQKPAYQKRLLGALRRGGNIGVILGPASGNLCTIDIDTDAEIEPFLALNPKLASTLRTNGASGCQIWIRVFGEYPERVIRSKLKVPGTKKAVAEWRGGGGCQSVIQGKHPQPKPKVWYRFAVEVPAVESPFDIQCPERWGMNFDGGQAQPSGGDDPGDVKTVELTPEKRERVLRYLDEVDLAVSGQGGSNPTFRFANVLLWGFALTIGQAEPFMLMYSAKCKPPWSASTSCAMRLVMSTTSLVAICGERNRRRSTMTVKRMAGTAWIPQETLDVAKDIDKPIVITEGQANGEALLKAGAFPIGLQGIKLKLRAELASFDWDFRQVLLCFDSGRLGRRAEIRAAFLLYCAGAEVYQLSTWPLGTDPAKQEEVFAELFGKAIPFHETLTRHDIDAAKKELHRTTRGDHAKFDSLANLIYKRLGVSKGALGAFQSGNVQRDEQNLSGAKAVDVPPTATPWEEEVEAEKVLDEICEAIKRFVWMKPSQRRAVALWIVLTYLHDSVDVLPILLVTSPEEECGKSTLFRVIRCLSNRPLSASNISAAAIYRTIRDICPTLILDEADTYLKEDETMRGVINSGHEKDLAFVIRVVNDKGDTGQFSTWCPKAIAMIGQPKRTIISRSIPIRLGRKSRGTKTEKLRKKHYEEFETLRRKISCLANNVRPRIEDLRRRASS